MKEDLLNKLKRHVSLYFPPKEGGCSGYGSPCAEPNKTDFLTIFLQAFKERNKEDEYDICWDRVNSDGNLIDVVQAKNPEIPTEEIYLIFEELGKMWDEWRYILLKMRKDHEEPLFTLVDTVACHADIYIAIE